MPINRHSYFNTQHGNQSTVAHCRYEFIRYPIDQTDGSEEIEFTTAYDVFVRAGFETTICGVNLANPPMVTYVLAISINSFIVVRGSSRYKAIHLNYPRSLETTLLSLSLVVPRERPLFPNQPVFSPFFGNLKSRISTLGQSVRAV